MIRSLVLIAVVIAFTCTAAWAQSPEHDTSDVGQVYRAFLDNWVGDEKSPINVSMSIKATSVDDVEEFADCAGNSEADWARADAIDDLRPLIGALSYVRLVDPRKWSPRDPADRIAQGEAVDSAVDQGMANGLLTFSTVVFDKSHTIAAFSYSFVCGGLCGNGGPVIFDKTANGWVRSSRQCAIWMSLGPGGRPNNAFKPKLHRYAVNMAGRACHVASYALQFGVT